MTGLTDHFFPYFGCTRVLNGSCVFDTGHFGFLMGISPIWCRDPTACARGPILRRLILRESEASKLPWFPCAR